MTQSLLLIFTEPANLHFLDVSEEYFNEYRKYIGGFYKAPDGHIVNHKEVRKSAQYQKPYYDTNSKEIITDEARKFLFKKTEDWQSCKSILQKMKRSLVQVSYFIYYNKNYFQGMFEVTRIVPTGGFLL